jgi:hypothetical protein
MDIDSEPASGGTTPVASGVDTQFAQAVTETLTMLNQKLEQLTQVVKMQSERRQGGSPKKLTEDIFAPSENKYNARRGKRTTSQNLLHVSVSLCACGIPLMPGQDAVRTHIRERLQINPSDPITKWPTADKLRVKQFSTGELPEQGPTNTYLLMDWNSPGKTDWMKDCATIFSHDFVNRHHNREFPLLKGTITVDEVTKAFNGYVCYLKRSFCKKLTDAHSAAAKQAADLRRGRSLNRRKQVIPLSICVYSTTDR